jgi:guanylate kinase
MDSAVSDLLENYKPNQTVIDLIKSTSILLLVGPTGAGKDSLKDRLLETGDYHHIVSHTTRPPRINHGVLEQEGREYHFIDMTQAKGMLEKGAFVESKIYSGNIYGTSVAEIQAAHAENKIALTDIEVQGVAEYKKFDEGVMAVFLLPPDFETWQARLQRRYGDVVDAADHKLRLQTALDELNQLLTTDHYTAVVNDDIDAVFAEVQAYAASHKPDAEKVTLAREVATKLASDIQDYLNKA